jgi:eukaryotic-like serine/threonine-protein kinase
MTHNTHRASYHATMLVCPKCGAVYTRALERCGLDGTPLIQQNHDPFIGRTVDRYRVTEMLGTGGMARVYQATHVYLEEEYALKIIHGELASDRSLAQRFQREAQAMRRIKHPNVVSVSDFGSTEGGLLFMAMELIEGQLLSQYLKEHGVLSLHATGLITAQLAAGLDAAHQLGFVHRDLKPQNIMITEEDGLLRAKILDFGLVRLLSARQDATELTREGQFFGTPKYMSPEQISGASVDHRADLYSLGIILFQMLTGDLPFDGDVGQLAMHHVSTPPPVPSSEYGGLTSLVLHLLEKHPEDRVPTAAHVREVVEHLGLFAA